VAGAEFAEVNPDLGRYFGVSSGLLVTRVASGTPAARAGLEPGDVVVRAGGEALVDVEDLRSAVDRFHGRTLQLRVVRQKKTVDLNLKLE
jgi:serine protease Do